MIDSAPATLRHSRRVGELLLQLIVGLQTRVTTHDLSKLDYPEKPVFDEYGPKLKTSTYDSPEYRAYLREMKVATDHHYANNRHHPEHFPDGVAGMTLVDVCEMLADWKAASERHDDGGLATSLEIQKDRFGLSDQLYSVLANTAREAGWLS